MNLDEARARVRAGARLALFSDFDGTLVPIFPSPHDTVVSPRATALLVRLVARPRTDVVLVSGRPASALEEKACAGLDDEVRARVTLIGNHGMEVLAGGVRREAEVATRARPAVARLVARVRALIDGVDGAVLEDKGISLSLHTRAIADESRRDALERAAAELATSEPSLERFFGKRVLEARPRGAPHKGDAIVAWLGDHGRRPDDTVALFLGDDVTDEDGFRALGTWGGLGIRVVDAVDEPRETAAQMAVDGVAGALALLEAIAGW